MIIASLVIATVAALAAVGSAIFSYKEYRKKIDTTNNQYTTDMALIKADLHYIKDAIAELKAELKIENGIIGEHEIRLTKLEEKSKND